MDIWMQMPLLGVMNFWYQYISHYKVYIKMKIIPKVSLSNLYDEEMWLKFHILYYNY